MRHKIPFNKPFISGKELEYIQDCILNEGRISGNGHYTHLCQQVFKKIFGFEKTFLTTSCTSALEMSAALLDIQAGDEIIVPSFTFVTTASAFIHRGAKIIFADSCNDHPNLDAKKIEPLINPRTKGIIPVHYAGVSCDMDPIIEFANKYNLVIIEDAAQAIDSYYKGKTLGTLGQLSTFSFHETKNIIAGEGGMLVINDPNLIPRAEIIWEKGTNRSAFTRGEVEKYEWLDVGSSYAPAETICAFLYAQLQNVESIQTKRIADWNLYNSGLNHLQEKGDCKLPAIPEYAQHNGHIFYLICNSQKDRDNLIDYLNEQGINAVFHYQALHKSPYYSQITPTIPHLPNAEMFTNTMIRLPLFNTLNNMEIETVIGSIESFYS